MEQRTEYVIRLSPKDRYRHTHIRVKLNDALTFAENDLKANWLSYRKRFMEEA